MLFSLITWYTNVSRYVNNLEQLCFKYLPKTSETDRMNGMTVNEVGAALGIHPKAAKTRLRRANIKPIGYAGPTALYDPSCIENIKEVSKGGRPKKDK
jgi:hypothetical protein